MPTVHATAAHPDLVDKVAVVTGGSRGTAYRGQPNEGEFRVTQILVHTDGGWLLAGTNIGPLSPTIGPPAG